MVIDETECLRLLRSTTIGRISVSAGALPVVVPVTYVLMGELILLRTVAASRLSTALDDAVVAFEVDDYDFADHRGWSVMVQGRARLLKREDELRMALAQPLLPWGDPDSPFFVTIDCDRVSGRRIGLPPATIPSR
jgi:nitroimidazol reductase NimA-like FMN-containing flavoprotein (pyridoxamine 5'-phosphate oxidase superfamily)